MNAAGAMLLLGIVLTLVFEVPINKQIAAWSPTAMPAHWHALRDRWVAFHFARTAAGVVALRVCPARPGEALAASTYSFELTTGAKARGVS